MAAHRAQADALDIQAQAKRRLADEYDAAQERGEIHRHGEHSLSDMGKTEPSLLDIPPRTEKQEPKVRWRLGRGFITREQSNTKIYKIDPLVMERHSAEQRAKNEAPVGVADLGLRPKAIHEACQIRDAEEADPGIVRRALRS